MSLPDPDRRRSQLAGFLERSAGASRVEIARFERLGGGAIQENWRLDARFADGPYAGEQALVLRTDAPSTVAVSLGRAQEFALLKAAASAGVTVPEALWLCEDTALLGRPFYVMRRLPGTAAGHLIVRPDGPGGDKSRLAERLGEELARIHSICPPRDDLGFLERPEGHPALWAISRYREHLDALRVPQPALEWGLRWCKLHAPPAGEITLIHQDFRTGNYMVDEDGLVGVLDWEFCAWGDPLSDLGWFCARCWRFGSELEAGGIAGRAAFYRGYERVSGRVLDADEITYWELMAHLRWAVIALQQGARVLSGGEESLELGLTGRIRPAELALQVLAATPPAAWAAGHD